jgi:hypothetical protein
MVEDGTSEAEAIRAAARLERLLKRVPVTLRLAADGAAELTFARDAGTTAVPPRRGTWALAGDAVTVTVAEAVEGASEGRAVLVQRGARLQLAWGAWTLLLAREADTR